MMKVLRANGLIPVKTRLRRILLALSPFAAGAGVYLAWHSLFQPVPLLVFRADIGSTLAVIGLLISLVLLTGVLAWSAAERRGSARLAEAQRAAEESRRQFILRLDHELKNPLTGLRAAMANLGAAHLPPPDARAWTDAQHQVERLSRLVADLRKLAELEERPIESAPVEIGEVLEETVDAVRSLPQYAGRQVNVVIARVPWPLPPVTGDQDLLGLAFYNLVENALKYSGPGDAVEVRAVEDGRWLTVEVADSGPGIAEDDLARVFDALYRGTNARGLEGSGLGLALVRQVIERHGGQVDVRSRQTAQKGTVFRVRLPFKKG